MTVPMIKSIGDVPYPIDTHSDAFSPLLTAGAANGITGEATDSAAWLQRVSASDGPTTVKSIHGRTLRWNQIRNLSTGTPSGTYGGGLSYTKNQDGSVTVGGSTTTGYVNIYYSIFDAGELTVGHKYLVRGTCPAGGTGQTYRGGLANSFVDTGSGGITTLSATGTVYLRFTIENNVTVPETTLWPQLFDLTEMFGAGSEPSTIAEFEALYPLPYYEYDAGSLLPVNMTGIETTGFNQWDEQWERGGIDPTTGQNVDGSVIRSKNYIPVFPETDYFFRIDMSSGNIAARFYDADKGYIGARQFDGSTVLYNRVFKTPANCRYMRFNTQADYGTAYKHDICINLFDPTRNGEYEPYWSNQRIIPAGTLRGLGTLYDELTPSGRITRVGAVALTSFDWTQISSPESHIFRAGYHSVIPDFKVPSDNATVAVAEMAGYTPMSYQAISASDDGCFAMSSSQAGYRFAIIDSRFSTVEAFVASLEGQMLHYELATPTVTPNDPPINLTYRTEQGGTERVMVPTGENSAPPTIVAAQGYTAESLRDAALSCIAPVENGLASTNYGVGSYLVHGGQLCKVTTAIATGEAITIGTNVTATTVMAEVIALIAQ